MYMPKHKIYENDDFKTHLPTPINQMKRHLIYLLPFDASTYIYVNFFENSYLDF